MSWAAGFRFRQYLRGSLWVLPLLGGVVGAILGSLSVDHTLHLPAAGPSPPATAPCFARDHR